MSRSSPADLAEHIHAQLKASNKKPPSLATLTELFEILFLASLKREENESITCRVAFMDRNNPDPNPPRRVVSDRWQCFHLNSDLSFDVGTLVKLSTATDPWGSTIAVDVNSDGRLRIWGFVDQGVHHSTFVVREAERGPQMPGVFQAVIQGTGDIAAFDQFTFLGSLSQESLRMNQQPVFEKGLVRDKLMKPIRTFQRETRRTVGNAKYCQRNHWDRSLENLWMSAICRLLIGIQRYRHGGAILISNSRSGLNPKYSLRYDRLSSALFRSAVCSVQETFYSDLIHESYMAKNAEQIPMQLYLDAVVSEGELQETNHEITGCVRFLASLTRVDGLIWFDSHLRLRGFGTEIIVRKDPPDCFMASNPKATSTSKLDLSHYGTRHRSMLRYCGAYPESLGFIVSQDGEVRAVACVDERVLLWDNIRIRFER